MLQRFPSGAGLSWHGIQSDKIPKESKTDAIGERVMLAVTIAWSAPGHLAVFRTPHETGGRDATPRSGMPALRRGPRPRHPTRCLIYTRFRDDGAYDHHVATDYYATFEDLSGVGREADRRVLGVSATGRRPSGAPERAAGL